MTPVHHLGLHIDPDVVRKGVAPQLTQAQASKHPILQQHGCPLLHDLLEQPTTKLGDSKEFATRTNQNPISNGLREDIQRQPANPLQVSSGDMLDKRSSQFANNASEKDQLEGTQRSTEVSEYGFETETIPEDIPPQFDNWGLPNIDLMYYIQGVPDNPHMMDPEYIEENPRCIPEISPNEALTFGTWTDWEFNHRIQRWMIEQDLDGITTSAEEVSSYSSNFIRSSATKNDNLFCEDTVRVWESVSSTEETAEHYQTLHEESKEGLATQVREHLDDEEDWLPGKLSLDMARVMEEQW
ncbi:hypothetical protein N431DRAFT_396961 [Stipitochalara longipes BDJ]|nr:hypothetical protein N431DRAFT_396961 [Stipitochalara longipes BDJ]